MGFDVPLMMFPSRIRILIGSPTICNATLKLVFGEQAEMCPLGRFGEAGQNPCLTKNAAVNRIACE